MFLSLEIWIALTMLLSLILYALSGGADFGGGVWDLFAIGPRAAKQRELISNAIVPIWEANHVWLIIVIVLLFVCFPLAFASVSIALHIPLAVMLLGIVFRGSAFVFRSGFSSDEKKESRPWTLVFAIASTVTPIMLGIVLGAVTADLIRVDPNSGRVLTNFISSWWAPFPFAVGFFTLTLFAFLAAVYLTVEARDPELQEDFRKRALVTALLAILMAILSYFVAGQWAPHLQQDLSKEWWSFPLRILTGIWAFGAIVALWRRRFALARIFAVAEVSFIILGWGIAQFPYLVFPDLTIMNTAAPESVLRPILIALAIGLVFVMPAFAYLYWVFKRAKENI